MRLISLSAALAVSIVAASAALAAENLFETPIGVPEDSAGAYAAATRCAALAASLENHASNVDLEHEGSLAMIENAAAFREFIRSAGSADGTGEGPSIRDMSAFYTSDLQWNSIIAGNGVSDEIATDVEACVEVLKVIALP